MSDSNDYRDKTIDRIGLLIIASILGLLLGAFSTPQFFYCCWEQNKTVAKYLDTAVVGIPIFMLLWYFRAHDVRQQIQQNHFNNAIENLVTKNFTTVIFGVRSLIKLSETTPYFNKLITRAFENKIEELNSEIKIIELKSTCSWDFQGSYRRELIKEMEEWPPDCKTTRVLKWIEEIFIYLFPLLFVVGHAFLC